MFKHSKITSIYFVINNNFSISLNNLLYVLNFIGLYGNIC
nr:MAG TPA: hypothetical protein [Caudoviricetes sp.]